jgi:hypothetical protein
MSQSENEVNLAVSIALLTMTKIRWFLQKDLHNGRINQMQHSTAISRLESHDFTDPYIAELREKADATNNQQFVLAYNDTISRSVTERRPVHSGPVIPSTFCYTPIGPQAGFPLLDL